jgi:amino acid transporter, AAT family
MDEHGQDMKRSLKTRHIMMITLGGTIGSGIFKGSSSSIGLAGPGVILPYLIGGIILLVAMKCMAELTVNNSKAKTLRGLIEPILGRFTGYFIGWIYWTNWVLVMAAEMAAASSFMQYWFPNTSLWSLALIMSVLMTALNLLNVSVYGETEYWLAGIKIATLSIFVVFGAFLIFAHHPANAAHNLLGHGGFFPHGMGGVLSAMLIVMFSFGGIEMIGMTLGETVDPERTIPKAARGVIVRVLLFYILPILVIVSLVPWNTLGFTQSPFVTVFSEIGIPYVGGIMNFVLLTAVLSAVNTGMYAASRMLYTQAMHGSAPKFFAGLSRGKVPIRALLFSTIFLYVGVIIAVFAKGHTFDYLMVFPSFAVMTVWSLLILAHLKSQGITAIKLVSFLALLLIFIGVIATTPVWGTTFSALVFGIVAVTYFFHRKSVNSETGKGARQSA